MEKRREREERGESLGRAMKHSSESMVTGVRWEPENGGGGREYRCYQTHTSHTAWLSLYFPFPTTVNHCPLKRIFILHLSLAPPEESGENKEHTRRSTSEAGVVQVGIERVRRRSKGPWFIGVYKSTI